MFQYKSCFHSTSTWQLARRSSLLVLAGTRHQVKENTNLEGISPILKWWQLWKIDIWIKINSIIECNRYHELTYIECHSLLRAKLKKEIWLYDPSQSVVCCKTWLFLSLSLKLTAGICWNQDMLALAVWRGDSFRRLSKLLCLTLFFLWTFCNA